MYMYASTVDKHIPKENLLCLYAQYLLMFSDVKQS